MAISGEKREGKEEKLLLHYTVILLTTVTDTSDRFD